MYIYNIQYQIPILPMFGAIPVRDMNGEHLNRAKDKVYARVKFVLLVYYQW